MRSQSARVTGMGWSGLVRRPEQVAALNRRSPIIWPWEKGVPARAGQPLPPADPEHVARVFPGRWNSRRALPEGLEPLVEAFAVGLNEAGWWAPGMPGPTRGSLVLGSDSHALVASLDFAGELAERGPVGISPTRFLFSLPSSAAAVLGILFGLRDYQATAVEGGLSGVRALAHGLDLLRMGRAERVAVGALSVLRQGLPSKLLGLPEAAGELDLAVAFCLEAGPLGPVHPEEIEGGLPLIEECCILDAPGEEAVPAEAEALDPVFRPLAAPPLLAVAKALLGGASGARAFVHREPGRPGAGVIRIAPTTPEAWYAAVSAREAARGAAATAARC